MRYWLIGQVGLVALQAAIVVNEVVSVIANGHPYGGKGYVILEEGEINRANYAFIVHHYLVSHPDGSQEEGTFTMEEAKARIDQLMSENG